jgi:hypothetical protein
MKLIIDATTGTVLNADGCYLVDGADFPDEELSDSEVSELAQRVGKSLHRLGSDTGWGDNAYRFTVSYSPLSIRDEAEALLEGGIYDSPGDETYKQVMEWARDAASQEELEDIALFIMSSDSVWDGFRENLIEAVVWAYREIHKS